MANLKDTIVNGTLKVTEKITLGNSNILDLIYPIGSIYMSVNSTNPGTLFGGTWVAWGAGRVPVGVDTTQTEFDTVEETGGSKYLQAHIHTLSGTAETNGGHTHSVSGTAATNGAHTHKYGYRTERCEAGTSRYVPQDTSYSLFNTTSAGDHTHSVSGTAASNGAHTHNVSGTAASTGDGNSQNLQPYITCYMWKRTA